MKRIIRFAVCAFCIALITAFALPLTACKHEHKWSAWQRTETEHYRTCACGEEQRGSHTDFVCDECAEFKVLAFGVTDPNGFDGAHADFAQEANKWFPDMGKKCGFIYDTTTDYESMTDELLSGYDLVMFLNNKPYGETARAAFQRYMENGGAWMGFHVCAFRMTGEGQTPDWDWFHEEFLGSGDFRTNTWNPTPETLKVETFDHPSTVNLPDTFLSAPNEWYGWTNDLRANPDITVLLSLDPSTFPVGDRKGEQWFEGDFPVAWSNNKYKMMYINMGHNLMDYNDFAKDSLTFSSDDQNKFIIDAMFGLTTDNPYGGWEA